MCWLVHKPSDVVIPEDLLRCAYTRNDDGFGVMYFDQDTKKVVVEKVLPKGWDDVITLYRKHAHRELGIHFRMRTSGATNLDMVHPFKVLDETEDGHDVYMMHNGILSGVQTSNTHSDTYYLATDHLKPLLKLNLELLREKKFRDLMVLQLGRNNKLLFLDDTGQFTRVYQLGNDSVAFDDGFWCSNTYAISGQGELGYDLEKRKDFSKEVKTTLPFSASGSARGWDEEAWENDMMGAGYHYGGGYNKGWTDPLKKPMTPTETLTQTGKQRVAINIGTGISASSIKIVKPKCTINNIAFKSVVDITGTTMHTRREPMPGPEDSRIAETKREIVNGVMTATHYNAKGVIINTEVKMVGEVKPALNHLPVPAGANDPYVKITPADIASMDDEAIWDWVVTYPDEAAEYLIELKEGMY